jgi:hypothetical protein
LRSLTTILLEDYQRTFGVFASEVGWEVQAGVKNTPYTAKRKEAFVRRSNLSVGQFDIGESYTILDDALYEFAVARVQNQSNAEQPRNYNFSSRVAKELNEYFQPQLQKNFNCSTPCCEACGFELKWGKHMNDLFSSAISPHSHQNQNKAQYVGRTVRKKSVTKMNAGADFSSKLKTTQIGVVKQQESKCTFCEDEGVNFNHDLLVPHTGGNTCDSIKLMAAVEVNGSDVCATLQKEESVCCPLRARTGTSLTPQPHTNDILQNVQKF